MTGRMAALCGWLAWMVGRPFRRTARGRIPAAAPIALAAVLAVLAAIPIVLPQLDPQPIDVGVDEIIDGAVTEPGTWVRLTGRPYRLAESPTGLDGPHALFVDADEQLRAIVVRGGPPFADRPEQVVTQDVTGRLVAATPILREELPIEATEAGTPPRLAPTLIVELDPVPKPRREVWWPLSVPPALLAVMLLIGTRTGYPIFRRTREVDVLTAPLGVGERLPAAYGGRIGPNVRELADPGGVLLLVRRGPKGNLLTAQPLPDDGGVAPAPVTIGGGWTSGRVGDVHAVRETVPALIIRSELVDATFLFARTAERDRVAALIAVER